LGEKRNAHRVWWGNLKERINLEYLWDGLEDIIKMDLEKNGTE
jgi:hypothetical protein